MNLNARNQQQKSRPYQSLADILANDKDRKSTRLNSSHSQISYAVFCLKKKTIPHTRACDIGIRQSTNSVKTRQPCFSRGLSTGSTSMSQRSVTGRVATLPQRLARLRSD